MQRLEVSGEVRPLKGSLDVKDLITTGQCQRFIHSPTDAPVSCLKINIKIYEFHFFVLFFIRAISKLYICIPT